MSVGTESMFQSKSMSTEERFDHWREVVRRTRECEVTSAHSDDFAADVRRSELGAVALLGTSFPSARFRRTERMVRQSVSEVCHVTLLTSGHMALRLGADQTEETFGPGDLSILDSSHAYDVLAFAPNGAGQEELPVEGVGIDVPAELLPVPPRRLCNLLGRRLSGRQGTGALLSEFLLGLDRQAAALQPAEASRLGTVLVDLVVAWLARELDPEAALPQETRRRAMVESVRAFIRHNLHDPDMTPSAIADAHHISVSYLHRVFTQESQGETVAAWIRSQRLKKAHHDLADPALRAVPIHAIAAQRGIPRADDFSRAFRVAYGLSPSEHRRQASGRAGE